MTRASRHGRRRPRQPLRQRHPRAGRRAAVLPRLPRHRPAVARRRRAGRRRASRAAAARTAARCSAARPRRCRASTPTASTTSPASSSASSSAPRLIDGTTHRAGRRADRPAVVRPAHQRLLAGAPHRSSSVAALTRRHAACRSSARRSATRCSRRTARTCRRSRRCSTPASSRAWRTSPAAASPTTCRASCRTAAPRTIDRGVVDGAAALPVACSERGDVADDEMLRTFNMGIGLIVVVRRRADRERVLEPARAARRDRRRRHRRRSSPATATVRYVGPMNRRLGVLISGRGSNLQAIIDAIAAASSTRRSRSSSRTARTRRACCARATAGIETLVPRSRATYASRDAYDRALADELRRARRRAGVPRGLHAAGRRAAARRVSRTAS